jgi:hypothetical protein
MAHLDTPSLLARLLATLGLGSSVLGSVTACGGIDRASEGAPEAGAPGTGTAAEDATGDVELQADAPLITVDRFITPTPPVPDAPRACWQYARSRSLPAPDLCPTDEDAGYRSYVCFMSPPEGRTCEETYDDACLLQCRGVVVCGPLPDPANRCCYVFLNPCPPPPGRPFIVAGKARIAPAGDDPSWAHRLLPAVDGLDADTRAALADVWTQDALTEHASVASFSRFVLQCLALGAPAEIVAAAQQACADEIEHARIGFGLASAYAGRSIGPGRLNIERALDDSLDPGAVACSVAREGCIAEMVSAAMMVAARDDARDPVIHAVLARMAEEELAHALLAWRYLRWVLEHGNERLRCEVAQVFAEIERHVALGASTSLAACPEVMRAHGYLPEDERRRIARIVIDEVIRPVARALLDREASGDLVPRERSSTLISA